MSRKKTPLRAQGTVKKDRPAPKAGQTAYEREITKQHENHLLAQAKLVALYKEYADLFEHSPVGYFILDKTDLIENVNERGCAQLSSTRGYLVGRIFSDFLHKEQDKSSYAQHLALVLETGELHRTECEIKRKDGTVFSALIKSTVVKDEQSKFKHLLSMVSDISAIKEHEHQVEIALQKAEELNEMKSKFIGMASHEFRTPLSTLLSSVSLLEQYIKTGDTDKMTKHLTRIKSSVKDLTGILDDFLSLEKLESGRVEIMRNDFNLPAFCKDLVEDIGSVMRKGQYISYAHAGGDEIREDRKIVQHVLQNLLSNACKYSGEDQEVNLSTTVDDNAVTLRVTDNGIGIPEEDQKNLFTRFFRARNAAAIQGTGLGLSIVKRYVELLNGEISFISIPHEGTSFIVTFPRDNT